MTMTHFKREALRRALKRRRVNDEYLLLVEPPDAEDHEEIAVHEAEDAEETEDAEEIAVHEAEDLAVHEAEDLAVHEAEDPEAPEEIHLPKYSINKYRKLELDNGLSVLLVAAPFGHHAAAITVGCGSFNDPPNMFGLAHLLEHAIFLGSENYPGLNQFKDFIANHGGEVFARTEFDYSLFSMRLSSSKDDWELALNMFADILSKPLFDLGLLERELTIIDAEFNLHKYRDAPRLEQLWCHTASTDHSFKRFPWGNKEYFSAFDTESIVKELTKLFEDCFVASNMKLVVVSDSDLDDLEDLVRRSAFTKLLTGRTASPPVFQPKTYLPTKEIWEFSQCFFLESLEDSQAMHISWMLPLTPYDSPKPERLIADLLCQENEGSLCSFLKSQGLVTTFSASVGSEATFDGDYDDVGFYSTSGGQVFSIEADLTNIDKRFEVVTFVFMYLKLLKVKYPFGSLIDEHRKRLDMKYILLESDLFNSAFFAQGLSVNMFNAPTTHALSLAFGYSFGGERDMEEIFKYLTPGNMRLDFLCKPFTDEGFQTETFFKAKYKTEAIPSQYISEWENVDEQRSEPLLSLPSLNEFMPTLFFEEARRVLFGEVDEGETSDDLMESDAEDDDDVGEHDSEREINDDDDDEHDSEVEINDDDDDDESDYELCVDSVPAKLFHQEDTMVLKSSAHYNIYTDVVDPGIQARTERKIIIEMIKEALTPILIKGADACIEASISYDHNNCLKLRFDGFFERFKDFIKEIWRRIVDFTPTEQHFQIATEKMKREFTPRDLAEQGDQMLSNALADTTLNDELNALKICTFEDVKDVRLFAVPRRVVGVCSGNFSKEESEELLGIFDATGSFEVPKEQMKKMPEVGVPLELKATPFTESETNSYAMVCFCNGDDSDKYSAINIILKAALHEHLYHELRLKAQLGYDFDLTLHLSSVMRGLHIYVVSPSKEPNELLDQIYKFAGGIGDFMERLEESSFERYKKFLADDHQEDAGISDELLNDNVTKDRLKGVKAWLVKVEKEEVVDFCKNFFAKNSCRSIEISIARGVMSDE